MLARSGALADSNSAIARSSVTNVPFRARTRPRSVRYLAVTHHETHRDLGSGKIYVIGPKLVPS